MPVSEDMRSNHANLDYKQKYRNLKRKLKILLYENESYQEELRKSQRQLLQVCRDKAFLLDRLVEYENVESTTSDSDATDDSSDSDNEGNTKSEPTRRKRTSEAISVAEPPPAAPSTGGKKKKTSNSGPSNSSNRSKSAAATTRISKAITSAVTSTLNTQSIAFCGASSVISSSTVSSTAPKSDPQPVVQSSVIEKKERADGQLTCEEIERHFETRSLQASLLMPEKTPLTVPVELFSNESSPGLPDDSESMSFNMSHK